jgi:hypothetical protein
MSTGAVSAGGRRTGAAALRWAGLGAAGGVAPVVSDAAGGSAFMMLTGGIDEAEGKNTSGPGTRKPTAGGAPAVGAEASAGGGDDGARPATGTSAAAGQPAA